MIVNENEIGQDNEIEVSINKKDLLTLLKTGKKVLELEYLKAKVTSKSIKINSLDCSHTMLVNLTFTVGSTIKDSKTVILEYDKIQEIEKIKEKIVTINLKEAKTEDEDVKLFINWHEFNVISISTQELSDLIKASNLLSCEVMAITDTGLEFSCNLIKIIKHVKLYDQKMKGITVHLNVNLLIKINEILKDFLEEEAKIYYGVKDGKEQPVLIKIEGYGKSLEIFIAPRAP